MRTLWARLLLPILAVLWQNPASHAANAQPTLPELTGSVVDKADLLDHNYRQELSKVLDALAGDIGHRIVIVSVPSLQGYKIEDYTEYLSRYWQIAGDHSGVIFLIAPNEKKVRIFTGGDSTSLLPDSVLMEIIDVKILPHFKNGDYVAGVKDGLGGIISTIVEGAKARADIQSADNLAGSGAQENSAPLANDDLGKLAGDTTDVVAQVLNYSSFGVDNGSGFQHWVKIEECKYKLTVGDAKVQEKMDEFTNSEAARVLGLGFGGELDLNQLDPRNIKFYIADNDEENRKRGFVFYPPGGSNTQVRYNGNTILSGLGERDLDRLSRGWRLVYDKYCRGTAAPF